MENTIEFSRIIQLIKKNLWLIVLLPIIFLLVSAILSFFLIQPKYQASTQVLVNQKKEEKNVAVQEVQGNIQLVNTYSEILKSPRILDKVSKDDDKYSSEELNEMVNVKTQANSQILNINVTSHDKKESEKIANKIANVFKNDMPEIMNVDNVSILSTANGTAEKVSPKTSVNLIIGLFVGLVLAIFIIALKEMLDKRIKSEEDVERELNVPVLGSIPKLK
ncbi:Wzz/FepE/Etk N-terminal domain-containing protein [Staphylococcus hominis]|uniref:Wzz/FepE/Etk N-terminal domain-containing protein n=1 Tax=Staphylococcus hominis TaxID=1290 RepID=UPI001F5A761F|nr:Wzz/FepE/Etk N-terminal domain-containing protein [Staphylococcus hominis]MCI2914799.1 Wzz/FepE/Etk N-terminal domain-containing protein [Staphylococcus hominis]MDO0981060.1 Wzz/FepE/Etk N-terminal domain-containing protein [Staphylococcus hominis]MDO0985428.1 Wzz/FepE/Etk N-terminal domain-containing protein [Staphylococcus hominis]